MQSSHIAGILYILAVVTCAMPTGDYDALSQEMVDYINSLNTTWKAALSKRFEGADEDYIRGLCDVIKTDGTSHLPVKGNNTDVKFIPKWFDARLRWWRCPTIREIRDQGSCGSGWALAAVGAMSDRICIKSRGRVKVDISVEDILTCCYSQCGTGCFGGFPKSAWTYWVEEGIVTGGQYGSKQGCRPYTVPHCSRQEPGKYPECNGTIQTPLCNLSCIPDYTKFNYTQDKHYGKSAYAVPNSVKEIQKEIMTNGPVTASFDMCADFPTYKSGVYQHKSTKYIGAKAVRILGWGVERGVDYWLIANSWDIYWGDKGYFKMIRGINDCEIETEVLAGEPKL